MFITSVLVAGSVAYAGIKTVAVHHAPAKYRQTARAAQRSAIANREATVEIEPPSPVAADVTLAERRQQAIATTSFCLAIGGLLFPPLTTVSIPLTLYSTVSILEAGCRSLYSEGRIKPSVFNSILLVSTLVTDHYLSAATIACFHHTFRQFGRQAQRWGEQVSTEVNNELSDLVRQAMGGPPSMVWLVRDTVEVKVPFAEVKVGDLIVVNRGEFIPADGVVTSGSAKVNLLLLTRSPNPVAIGVGEQVYTTTFVMEGRLQIRVEKLRPNAP